MIMILSETAKQGRGGSTGRGDASTILIPHYLKKKNWSENTSVLLEYQVCIIERRDEKSNLTIPYPRPNERRYLGQTWTQRYRLSV